MSAPKKKPPVKKKDAGPTYKSYTYAELDTIADKLQAELVKLPASNFIVHGVTTEDLLSLISTYSLLRGRKQ